jgi:hypothetical protein
MLQGSKDTVHLPDSVIHLKVKRIKNQIKQNIWICRNMLPRLRSDKLINPKPHPRRSPKANKRCTPAILNPEEEPSTMPAVVCLGEGRDVVAHCRRAVVDLWRATRGLLHVNILAEEVKPGARAIVVGGSAEAVADGLETLFGEVAGDVENVEEFYAL